MIPKIIHFVWVGGNPLTPLAEECIESWKKYCPDFEIKRWDESNFDINSNRYCREAYEAKKWAFVSDYIRVKVLHEYGGVYMDTDVELIKPIDKFLDNPAFIGFETEETLATAVIGTEKGNPWLQAIIDFYENENKSFYLSKKRMDFTTNVQSITAITEKMYPEHKLNGNYLELPNVTIYPKDYFSPIDYNTKVLTKTKNTHGIHKFCASWVEKPTAFGKFKTGLKKLTRKIIGNRNYEKLKKKIKGGL